MSIALSRRIEETMAKRKDFIEAGTSSTDRVWIGAPSSCYDEVTKPISKRKLHVLCFKIHDAEAVVQMLQAEIDRVKSGK